ncbi:MAG: L-seryl-tRNA(Sec) selenium transferase [Planctomycetota bacterium]
MERSPVLPADPRRQIPPVHALMEEPALLALSERFSRPRVLVAVQRTLDECRSALRPGDEAPPASALVERIRTRLAVPERDRLRPVVNATGVILHTGLGRAVLPAAAAEALSRMDRCCNMQIDMGSGRRGKRNATTEHLLTELTGAEAAMVVNNNAGATFLILTALCAGKDVIISRGQLIEIGGSFRLPDCIHQSGAHLVEVGTTNRTHLRDYAAALGANTGAILRCQPSNYRIIGFTKEVTVAELASLKEKQPFLLIDDLGCGALVDLRLFGLPSEPTARESLEAGADLACFSGDKLIGGPQAGIIVGRKALIDRIRKHPMTRMLRVCKLTDIALEQTLRLFFEPESLARTNPTYGMLATPLQELEERARTLEHKLASARVPLEVRLERGESATGGGSLPAVPIGTIVLLLSLPGVTADELTRRLRDHEPPVIARIADDEVVIDMRTLLDGEAEIVFDALCSAAREATP